MEATVHCPVCRTAVDASATDCPICGARLVASDGQASQGPAPAAPPPGVPEAGSPPATPVPADMPPTAAPPSAAPAPLTERLVIPGPPPTPGPDAPSVGRRLAIGCGAFVVVLAVLGAIAGGLFLATGGIELLKPVEPVTFDTIDDFPVYRRVAVTGRLDLPGRLRCRDTCGVWLVDPADPEHRVGLFIRIPAVGATAGPNEMESMPAIYGTDDFRVHLSDGTWAGAGDAVRVTGELCRTEETNEVCLVAGEIAPD